MEIKLVIEPPILPEYVCTRQITGLRQDGFRGNNHLPIESLTLEQAIEYSEMLKDTFMRNYTRLKK
jgi:hypothetical protein